MAASSPNLLDSLPIPTPTASLAWWLKLVAWPRKARSEHLHGVRSKFQANIDYRGRAVLKTRRERKEGKEGRKERRREENKR